MKIKHHATRNMLELRKENEQLKSELEQAKSEASYYERYVFHYGDPGSDCQKCGNLTHRGYKCFQCGWSGDDDDDD